MVDFHHNKQRPALWTRNFVLLCVSSLAFFLSFYFLLPTMPTYVRMWGGRSDQIGLIIGVFALASLVLRPFLGHMVDTRGRKWFIVLGAFIFFVSSSLYYFAHTVAALLGVRILHGAGMGVYNTATTTLVADCSPAARRGEAIGIYGTFMNLAMAIGPAVGGFLVAGVNPSIGPTPANIAAFATLFVISAITALVSVFLSLPVKDVKPGRQDMHAGEALTPRQVTNDTAQVTDQALIPQPLPPILGEGEQLCGNMEDASPLPALGEGQGVRADSAPARDEGIPHSAFRTPHSRMVLFSREAAFPGIVMLTITATYGTLMSFLPDLAQERRLGDPGLFFTVYAIVLIAMRVVAGAVSDRKGRGFVIAPGILFVAAAMGVLTCAKSPVCMYVAAVLYAVGMAATQPALTALAVDRVGPGRRGAAMGTFTAAFELGLGGGAIAFGMLLSATSYTVTFLGAAVIALVGFVIFVIGGTGPVVKNNTKS